jgi:uracil phosphoribosyltransferase
MVVPAARNTSTTLRIASVRSTLEEPSTTSPGLIGSAVVAASRLKEKGVEKVVFVGVIAAPEGIALLTREHPDVEIHVAAMDERLNERGYIVPGLGDAGDRQNATGANDPTDDPFVPEAV